MHLRMVGGLLIAAMDVALAQGGALMGTVHADTLNRPIAEALVTLPRLAREARTDQSGRYRFLGVPVGAWQIVVRRPGFSPMTDTVRVLNDTAVQHFVLSTLTVTLDSVTSTSPRIAAPAMRAFEQRRLTGVGTFLTAEQLRRQDDRKLYDILRSVPGGRLVSYQGRVFLASARGAANPSVIARAGGMVSAIQSDRRSPRACWVQVILDGTRLYYAGSPGDVPDLGVFAGRQFAGIEFYRSQAATPAEFNPAGAACGTLVLWTRGL